MHRKVAVALVAALALGVASCGSSEPSLTRAQLVRRIEAACQQARKATEKQQARFSADRTGASFIVAIVGTQRAALATISDLNPPDAAKDDFDTFKEGMEKRLALFRRVESAGRAGIQSALAAARVPGEAITNRLQQAARRLGVEGCA